MKNAPLDRVRVERFPILNKRGQTTLYALILFHN